MRIETSTEAAARAREIVRSLQGLGEGEVGWDLVQALGTGGEAEDSPDECSPPAWGGRLAAALAMIFKTLRTCKDDDNLLLRETGDWSYGAVQW